MERKPPAQPPRRPMPADAKELARAMFAVGRPQAAEAPAPALGRGVKFDI